MDPEAFRQPQWGDFHPQKIKHLLSQSWDSKQTASTLPESQDLCMEQIFSKSPGDWLRLKQVKPCNTDSFVDTTHGAY